MRTGAKPDRADVLIVGSGMGGAPVAKVLAEAGIKVVCLEQGGWVNAADYPHESRDWEIQRMLGRWSTNPNVRGLPEDYPVTGDSVRPLMYNAVGGSTIHYTGCWPRFRPSDFRKGTEHGESPDWPLTYEDLAPYYEMNDLEMGIAGIPGDPAYPPRGPRQTAPIPPGPLSRAACRGFERLGWHWWPFDTAVITSDYGGRTACNYCGNCQSGCPRKSIGSTDVTYWPKAIASGAELQPNCRVQQITVDERGRAKGAVYVDRATGLWHEQEADVVVVACNGIGTPRLLLNSASALFRDGLANGSGQVGRNLMHHALALVELWVEEPLDSHKGIICAPSYSAEFAETDVRRGFLNGLTLVINTTNGPGYQAAGGHSRHRAPWGAGHHPWFREHFDHVISVLVQGEDLPCPDNRVTLDAEQTDGDGIPAPHVEYRLHPNDRKLLDFGVERSLELGEAVGAFDMAVQRHSSATHDYQPPAWHLLGTCRMGDGAGDSVTNRWHQAWDVPNLYICDGSSLVTGGAVNPTSTIGALAVRCAHHLRDNFATLRRATKTTAD